MKWARPALLLLLLPVAIGLAQFALKRRGAQDRQALADAKRYNPRVSPLPKRTPKPLEEWGIAGGKTMISHTFSAFSDPMYPSDFEHFDYVNPDAFQGGTLRLAARGTFDNFNRYDQEGSGAIYYFGDGYLYDTLMVKSHDEIDALYPLIAQKIEYAKDFSYVIFHIDPRARFLDGRPITADDVVFSFNKFFFDELWPQFSGYFAGVSVRAVSEGKVRFDLARPSRNRIAELANLTILPQQFWKDRELAEPIPEIAPNMGSGGWEIIDYEMGSWTLLEKRDDYWAVDLPVKRGLHNFRYYRIHYYEDRKVEFEAFKAGSYDFHMERDAEKWATQYKGPLFESGAIIQAPFPDTKPPVVKGIVFNLEKPLFQDYRVRRALAYALDFEWMNQNLFHGLYRRVRSYFTNTVYEAKGLPSKEELEILEPVAEQIPPEVFTTEYQPPDGGITAALALLKEAGWELENGVLQNRETGEPFVFEIMIYNPGEERITLPVQENLKKMGITMNIHICSWTEHIERLQNGQYDTINYFYNSNSHPPGEIDQLWHGIFINDPAIRYLINGIMANQQNKEALIHWGRAFDRVLQHQGYMILQWYIPKFWVAHIDKFGKPEVWPKYGSIDTWEYWWLEPEKLAALNENLRQGRQRFSGL